MDSFIELTAAERREVCEQGFMKLNLAAVSIEKDFWVCWTLRELFGLPVWGEKLTFKGGTSLSKCWKLISRFSEDIDVTIDREFLGFGGETLNNSQKKALREKCSRRVQEELLLMLDQRLQETLPNDLEWQLMPADKGEDPDMLTLLFQYPSVFKDSPGYVHPVVKIELGARADTEPVETPLIQPYLAEAFPGLLKDSGFNLRTVAARRTFWEKAMLLHEENFRPKEKKRKARLSRHYYDLWCMIRAGVAIQAMADTELFERIARHRQAFFKQNWVDYTTMCRGSLQVLPLAEYIAEWRRDYEAMRNEMFFNAPPSFEEILSTVRQFQEEFNRM